MILLLFFYSKYILIYIHKYININITLKNVIDKKWKLLYNKIRIVKCEHIHCLLMGGIVHELFLVNQKNKLIKKLNKVIKSKKQKTKRR